MFVVFDLDGTLALNEHRQHFVQRPAGEKKDWDAFYEACDKDTCNEVLADLARLLYDSGAQVEIWSGRSDQVQAKTLQWIKDKELDFVDVVRMRAAGDFTPDVELKKAWLDACEKKPDLVFDDRASVVAMWRANGVVCAQVAPGEF